MKLQVQEQAAIRFNERTARWEVHIGVTIPYTHINIYNCELYCSQRGIPVRNQDEINRVKYNNMPTWEGIT